MLLELLQQVGLTKYESEAYTTLLTAGPLTGYELGKRSAVPLSRSYEILERLTQEGLALVQPADPPRYAAADPEAFVARMRAAQSSATLDALAAALTALPRARQGDDFWIVRARDAIERYGREQIGMAHGTIAVAGSTAPFDATLLAAQQRGCRIIRQSTVISDAGFALLLDGDRCVAGTRLPSLSCQAVTSTNPALLVALRALMSATQPRHDAPAPTQSANPHGARPLDWLDWETRKQRRLLGLDDHEAA